MYWAIRSCWEKNYKTKNFPIQPFSVQIFPKYFSLTWIFENICCCFFQESVQLVPSLYHILHQACQNSNWFLWKLLYCWDGVSTRTKYLKESETDKIFSPKYFLSEIILTTENGGGGTHFARFLIFQILKGITHFVVL